MIATNRENKGSLSYNNLILVGTTHLTPKEVIIDIIKKEQPDIIGVELCQTRLNIMVLGQAGSNQTDESLVGKISNVIKKKAEEEKLTYGSDQITASKYALENKIPLLLVDREASEINYLMNKIPIEEQKGFMNELVKFQSMNIKESTKNISEEQTILNLKTNYPIAYELLITSRELFIMNKILKCLIQNPNKKLLVFLGVGHIKSIEEKL